MNLDVIAYLFMGCGLVVLFSVIIKYYYAKRRSGLVEEAKYRMLDDD